MNINLGNLKFVRAKDHPELIAQPVAAAISSINNNDLIGVAEIDQKFSDTAASCDEYKIDLNHTANCVILEAKRNEKTWFAACVVFGNTRADVNGLARRTLDARKVSFAPMEKAVAESKMEYGAITPIGLPNDWPILVDKAVADTDYVVIGSGIRKTKLAIPGKMFQDIPNVQILESLGKVANS